MATAAAVTILIGMSVQTTLRAAGFGLHTFVRDYLADVPASAT
jgi:hypothetical protein